MAPEQTVTDDDDIDETQGSGHGALFHFLFVHEIDEYPTTGKRTGYLALAVLATIVLYYTYYTQTGVTPNILRQDHMTFSFYVWIVIVSNLIGAFASLPASKTDRLGRSNVVIYGLLVVGLLIAIGVPNASGKWGFGIVVSIVGLVEGAILVATPALVRDFSPQLGNMGRASAMGFWTIGPVAGSLVTSLVAQHTLTHFGDWQSQFIISGISSVVVFVVALVWLKDLSPRLRDQLMVSAKDRTLIEARARGISEQEVLEATSHPWRQILKWDLVISASGIAVFLLVYYAAAGFFTIYYSTTFKNPDGSYFSVSQANGLNTWFWGADAVALIVFGMLSDRLRVRKPFMLVGTAGAIAMLIVFLLRAEHASTGYYTIVVIEVFLAAFLSLSFAPWMAAYTETVEAKNPALVGTGLALWGWILRIVVGVSFIFLPIVISSVNPVVNNQPYATAEIQQFLVQHPKSVAFAQAHQSLLLVLNEPKNAKVVSALAADQSGPNIQAAQAALGPVVFGQLVKYKTELTTLVVPYAHQLNYLAANQSHLLALQNGVGQSPKQWQHWFWVCVGGMVLFIPTIFLTKGRWSPSGARKDEEEHAKGVAKELGQLVGADA
jgi:Major Facilitator Superfamily